jgi:hypothetical protein
MKKLIFVAALIASTGFFSCGTLGELKASISHSAKGPGSNDASQMTAITAKWDTYKPKSGISTYSEQPSIAAPYNAGSLTKDFLNNGLNTLKFIRYLAGLSENITVTDELNDTAQHGAVLLVKTGHLTYNPAKPEDMDNEFYQKALAGLASVNIYQGTTLNGNLPDAVKSFIDDTDENNIEKLGHRRWMLNPVLGKAGFGYASNGISGALKSFTTMHVSDTSNTEKTDVPYILWPSKGFFPSSFFSASQAWSVILNPDSFDLEKCDPTVKLSCLNTGKEWEFSAADKDKKGKYFNVDQSNFGIPYCIIFRPDNLSSLTISKNFKVEIKGLVDKSGNPQQIDYEVEFFSL